MFANKIQALSKSMNSRAENSQGVLTKVESMAAHQEPRWSMGGPTFLQNSIKLNFRNIWVMIVF